MVGLNVGGENGVSVDVLGQGKDVSLDGLDILGGQSGDTRRRSDDGTSSTLSKIAVTNNVMT